MTEKELARIKGRLGSWRGWPWLLLVYALEKTRPGANKARLLAAINAKAPGLYAAARRRIRQIP